MKFKINEINKRNNKKKINKREPENAIEYLLGWRFSINFQQGRPVAI